jgi:AcrR family transcriptional regulator
MARPRTQLLSREIILDAALELINLEHDFTVLGIGRRLGVNPSSLYHHLKGGRDEIINGLRERLYNRIDLPSLRTSNSPWQSRIEQWVRSYRDAVAAYPTAIPILIGRMVDDIPTLAVYETLATILVEAGVPSSKQVGVIAMLDALVFGSAIDAGSPEPLWDTSSDHQPHLHRAIESSSTSDRVVLGLEIGIDASVSYIERLVGRIS